LRREKIASNQQIARAFHVDVSALEPMLEIWLRKGVLSYAEQGATISCASRGACSSCRAQSIVYYRYVGS
ncbi:MAG: hypothetical protein A3F46_01740, partial [Legionellales bacterium RIFCSPHIGHO2_12_FULL_42_9]